MQRSKEDSRQQSFVTTEISSPRSPGPTLLHSVRDMKTASETGNMKTESQEISKTNVRESVAFGAVIQSGYT